MYGMKRKRLLKPFILLLCLISSTLSAKSLNICVDDSDWMPYIYHQEDSLQGIHIDIIRSSLDSLGLDYQFQQVPWKRCLKGLEKGRYDAVATASYSAERNEYLCYPKDASITVYSQWRVGQVEYVIALPSGSDYSYDDNPFSIPQPVRTPRGYSIGHDLRATGIEVDSSAANDLQNIKRMLRAQSGSVITLPSIVGWLNKQKAFSGKLKFSEKPLKSKSYFFAISRNGSLTELQANTIWGAISKARTELNNQTEQSTHIPTLREE